jgi:hypothetical protein
MYVCMYMYMSSLSRPYQSKIFANLNCISKIQTPSPSICLHLGAQLTPNCCRVYHWFFFSEHLNGLINTKTFGKSAIIASDMFCSSSKVNARNKSTHSPTNLCSWATSLRSSLRSENKWLGCVLLPFFGQRHSQTRPFTGLVPCGVACVQTCISAHMMYLSYLEENR